MRGGYIADFNNHRVLYYAGTSTTATRVYGQVGMTTGTSGGTSATALNWPVAIATNASGVYVVDNGNNRVLFYAGTATTATRVYGQLGSFTTATANNGGTSANSLNAPAGVAVDAGGVYIADSYNSRVLYYTGTATTATRVYGQLGSFTTGTSNNGGISADSLAFMVINVGVDATGAYIVDYGNHRVLYYSGTATTATRVYGQFGSFITGTLNNGGVSANSLNAPGAVAIDSGGRVYILDSNNNRALFY